MNHVRKVFSWHERVALPFRTNSNSIQLFTWKPNELQVIQFSCFKCDEMCWDVVWVALRLMIDRLYSSVGWNEDDYDWIPSSISFSSWDLNWNRSHRREQGVSSAANTIEGTWTIGCWRMAEEVTMSAKTMPFRWWWDSSNGDGVKGNSPICRRLEWNAGEHKRFKKKNRRKLEIKQEANSFPYFHTPIDGLNKLKFISFFLFIIMSTSTESSISSERQKQRRRNYKFLDIGWPEIDEMSAYNGWGEAEWYIRRWQVPERLSARERELVGDTERHDIRR